jgi:hypothetical protein
LFLVDSKRNYSHLDESSEDDDIDIREGDAAGSANKQKSRLVKKKTALPQAPLVPPPMISVQNVVDHSKTNYSKRGENTEDSNIDMCEDEEASSANKEKSHPVKKQTPLVPPPTPLQNVCGRSMSSDSQASSIPALNVAGMSSSLPYPGDMPDRENGDVDPQNRNFVTPTRIPSACRKDMTGTNLLSPADLNDKLVITLIIEMKASIKELQRQTEINTQMLQTLLDIRGGDDSILETCNVPVDSLGVLADLEDLLRRDTSTFTKLVSTRSKYKKDKHWHNKIYWF